MARFRPFGRRQAGPADQGPDPWLDDPVRDSPAVPDTRGRGFDDRGYGTGEPQDVDARRPDRYGARAPGRGFGDPDDLDPFATSLPATRAATPAMWAPRRSDPEPVVHDDAPVTDPFGFPPVPPVSETVPPSAARDRAPAWAAWVPGRRSDGSTPARDVAAVRSPGVDEGTDVGGAAGTRTPEADRAGDPPDPTADHGGHPERAGRARADEPAERVAPTAPSGRAEPIEPTRPTDRAGLAEPVEPADRGGRPGEGGSPEQVDARDRTDDGDGRRDDRPADAHRDASSRSAAADVAVDGAAASVADRGGAVTDVADVAGAARRQAVRVAGPPPVVAGAAFPEPRREPAGSSAPVAVHREVAPDAAEAAALAGAFAADYLSWDEDDPARRGRALADHLPGSPADHALLGWSGAGRQRAEIVLPGAVRPDGDERVLVDVRVRVTPYRRVSRSEATPEPDPQDTLGTPAAAPPVTARGWRGLAARWVRLGVTVVRDGDRLVVDAGEEAFDAPIRESPRPPSSRPDRTAEDPTLDGDDDGPHGSGR